MASFIWLSFDNGVSGDEIFLGFFQMQWFAFILTIFAALSMTSDLRFYSGKDINLRKSQPFIAILFIVLIFGIISHNPAEIIFLLSLGYALSGYVSYFKRKMKKSKSILDGNIFD